MTTATLPVQDASIELFRPTETSPYLTNNGAGIKLSSVAVGKRAEVGRDDIQAELLVEAGQLSDPPRSGDRVEITLDVRTIRSITGMVRDIDIQQQSPTEFRLSLSPIADFVFSVLSFRNTFDNFEGETIADILQTVIQREAPEIDTDISGLTDTTDLFADGTRADDVVRSLINRARALAASDGTTLTVRPIDDLPQPVALNGDEHGQLNIRRPDDGLRNVARIDGATDTAVDDENVSQSSFVTVDGSGQRESIQVSTRKAAIAAVQIRTKRQSGDGDLQIRVQKDDGGSPVAVNDPESDIVATSEPAEFLATGGDFTRVQLPDHTLPEPDPHIIVEAENGSQDVGVDANGDLSYRVEFDFPLAVRERNQASVSRHRRRDIREQRDNVSTTTAARDRARAILKGRGEPRFEVAFQAASQAAFELELLDTVTLPDAPGFVSDRELVITERQDEFQGGRLRTEFTALDPTTIH